MGHMLRRMRTLLLSALLLSFAGQAIATDTDPPTQVTGGFGGFGGGSSGGGGASGSW